MKEMATFCYLLTVYYDGMPVIKVNIDNDVDHMFSDNKFEYISSTNTIFGFSILQ